VIKRIIKDDFAKQVMVLVSGATIAQAISFFSSLATSRLFTPEAFGILGFYLSALGISGVLANGKYDLGIVVVKDNAAARHLVRLCIVLLFLFSLLLTLFGLFAFYYAEYIGISEDKVQWMPYLGLGVFLAGYANVMYMFYTRLKKFRALTVARILESLGLNGLAIAFSFLGSSGLLIGCLASYLLSILYYEYHLQKLTKDTDYSPKPSSGLKALYPLAKQYINFPKYNIFLSFLEMLQTQSVYLLGFLWFSTSILGWFQFAMRILQVPLFLVVKPIGNVFLAKAADQIKHETPLLPLVHSTIMSTFVLALPIALILFLLGPTLFAFLFGESWRSAGTICSIMSVWMVIDMIRVPVSQIPVLLGQQKQMVIWTSLGTLVTLVSILVAGVFYSTAIVPAFAIITSGQCLFAGLVILVTYRQAKIHDLKLV
jgi:O-antigen/teichoic acid export membrane protein